MYAIEFIERGEQFRYVDNELSLILERTYVGGHRIFTESIAADPKAIPLSFEQRASVIENLCEYFDVAKNEVTFVIWETDPHRAELESLLRSLQNNGNLISIELDNEEKRQAAQDRQNLKFLEEGWKVSVDGRDFKTVDAYKEWMRARRTKGTDRNGPSK